MKNPALFILMLFGGCFPPSAIAEVLVEDYGRFPLSFEARTSEPSGYFAQGEGYRMFLNPTGTLLQFGGGAIHLKVVEGNPSPRMSGQEQLPGVVNYFIGNDPKQWRTDVPTYGRILYEQVYPGVNLVYYGNGRQLEHDFVLLPGADPKVITMKAEGVEEMNLDQRGDLILRINGGNLQFSKPLIYQTVDGRRREIDGRFVLKNGNRFGFAVGEYDRSLPLIIDPVLVYASFNGGSKPDIAWAVAVDSSGNAYMTGSTSSANLPTVNPYQSTKTGYTATFITKVNPTGTMRLYSTYLSATGEDDEVDAYGIAVDADGNAYVVGSTFVSETNGFPTTPGAYQTAAGGNEEVFVTKIGPAGNALVFSTLLGGTGRDEGAAVAIDSSRNVYVTGTTDSSSFPTTPGAYQTVFGGSGTGVGGNYQGDAFVTKISADGSSLVYSTFLGGAQGEGGLGIAVYSNKAYVAGVTGSLNSFPTINAYQFLGSGSSSFYSDAFYTVLSPDGSAILYSTYLGGSAQEYAKGVAVDQSGNGYITGPTQSSADFPTTPGAFRTANGTCFVTKFDPTQSGAASCVYSTVMLGDGGAAIAVDPAGNAYITGTTLGGNLPTTNAFDSTIDSNIGQDAYVAAFNSAGTALLYCSYLGGQGVENGYGIAVDADGSAYIVGETTSAASSFPVTPGAFQSSYSGSTDGFIVKVAPAAGFPASQPTLGAPAIVGNQLIFQVTGTAGSQYVVQTSTNIASSNWISFKTNSAPFWVTNSPVAPGQFYRGKVAP